MYRRVVTYYKLVHESPSMKGSFNLLGWSCANDFTSSFIFSADVSLLLDHFLFIFIKANPLSLSLVMVVRMLVLTSFSWLKLLLLLHNVIGKVKAKQSITCKLGNCIPLQEFRTSTNLLGISALASCSSFHFATHMLYSVDNITEWSISVYRVAVWTRLGRRVSPLSRSMHLFGRRHKRPRAMEWAGLSTSHTWSWETTWERNSLYRMSR